MKRNAPIFLFAFLFGIIGGLAVIPASHGADSIIPPGWRIYFANVPRFISNPLGGPTDRNGLAEGIRTVEGDAPQGFRQLDLREWLTRNAGVPFPPDAVALYSENSGSFICIAPAETTYLIETMFSSSCGGGAPVSLRLEATLATFECPGTTKLRGLRPERVRSVAGGTWREVEHLMILTRPGQRTVARHREGDEPREQVSASPTDVWSPPLAVGEAGCAVELEANIGPDGEMIDLNYAFHRRYGRDANADQIEALGTTILKDGTSVIVNFWPQGTTADALGQNRRLRLLALIIRAEIVNAEGIPLRQAFATKVRETQAKLEKAGPAPAIPGLSPE